jgi:hypothetical protein
MHTKSKITRKAPTQRQPSTPSLHEANMQTNKRTKRTLSPCSAFGPPRLTTIFTLVSRNSCPRRLVKSHKEIRLENAWNVCASFQRHWSGKVVDPQEERNTKKERKQRHHTVDKSTTVTYFCILLKSLDDALVCKDTFSSEQMGNKIQHTRSINIQPKRSNENP